MTPEIRLLLPVEQLTKPRTPADLAAWVAERCEAIAAVEATREPALMHKRPFKEFYEEIYPLNLFVTHCYRGRDDVLITPTWTTGPEARARQCVFTGRCQGEQEKPRYSD